MKKNLLSIVILGTITFSSLILPITADAETYTDKIEDAKQTENLNQNKIDAADQKINGLSAEKNNTQIQLETINKTISINKEKSQKLVGEIEKSQDEMVTLKIDIESLEKKIEKRNEQLDKQARTVQTNGDTQNYIEFVIEAESLVDVIGRVDVINQMVTANKTLVEEQVQDQKLVVKKKVETEQTIVQQNALAAQLENTQSSFEKQLLEKEVVVSQLASEMSLVQEDKDAFLIQKVAAEQAVLDYTTAQADVEKAVRVAFEQQKEEETRVSIEVIMTETVVTAEQNTAAEAQTSSRSSSSNQESNAIESVTQPSVNEVASTPAPTPVQVKKPTPVQVKKPAPTLAPSTGGTSLGSMQSAIDRSLASVTKKKYLWGGDTLEGGFDCSGFTQYVLRSAGVSIPRVASVQYSDSKKVSSPKAGDLVFFSIGGGTVDHVGIVTGGGGFVGSQSSTGVAYTSYTSGYWANRVVGFGRY
ncbi:N-terminal domain of peptidoglycan hydrolase CwlO-containing protein [Carnobacterium iners]|uniref:N-terminal domain of peptidoglycan hydrolase CwlO-containing protein n=1 Tax=Carnobacterium iners TaxID=1073423 RepID=A0A1X7NSW8_9LACT|nr:C40 family peptidase [Carnobacterium iners]SEK88167.1 N-terminal domain of peptidoglycan hydrolase CwlO-containing protein [Carnobacterium iners]SMH40677.1 N-terminal domain of peptidoglycan hydrolase CwlO-containing protein [Carnobacterium iners]